MLLFTGELTHLQFTRMRAGAPVDVARALKRLIGPDAVEVIAAPAVVPRHLTCQRSEQFLEAGLRIETRVDERFAAQRHIDAAHGEAEREACGKLKVAVLLNSAAV